VLTLGNKMPDIVRLQGCENNLGITKASLQKVQHNAPIITACLTGQSSDIVQIIVKAINFGEDWFDGLGRAGMTSRSRRMRKK